MSQSNHVVGTYEKNSKEEVRVSVDDFHGRQMINIRVFYKSAEGEWLPGRQGISISPEHYRELAEALVKAGEILAARGVLRL
jgi:hypothetical protein